MSRLPEGNAIFQQCIHDHRSVTDIVASVMQQIDLFHRKRSVRILRQFHDNTRWLDNISGVIDVVTQTQAGIGCPLWAPIKFVLLVLHPVVPRVRWILTTEISGVEQSNGGCRAGFEPNPSDVRTSATVRDIWEITV